MKLQRSVFSGGAEELEQVTDQMSGSGIVRKVRLYPKSKIGENIYISYYLCIGAFRCYFAWPSKAGKTVMPIDILFLVALGYGFWQGFRQGIIHTVFNVAAYVFGITIAFKMTPSMTSILQSIFHSDNPSMFLGAFIVNLLLVVLLMRVMAAGMVKVLSFLHIGIVNKALGACMMGGFYVLVCSILVWFMVRSRLLNDATVEASRTYPIMEPMPEKAYNFVIWLKPFVADAWSASLTWMDRMENYSETKTKDLSPPPKIYKPEDAGPIERDPAPSAPTAYPPPDADGIEE